MIQWQDDAVILSARPHGEHSAIVTVLTPGQGRYAGLVAGGQGRRWHGVLQPGNFVKASWRARLPEYLGHFTFDLMATTAARWLDAAFVLAAISSACAVTERALPERQPLPGIYAGFQVFLDMIDADMAGAAYVQWELSLLGALGYGLDLTACAVTQSAADLVYVSPRSGRAVSREAGLAYHDRLLPLPRFLTGASDWSAAEVIAGLRLTGYFLTRYVFAHCAPRAMHAGQDNLLPSARRRLETLYQNETMRTSQRAA